MNPPVVGLSSPAVAADLAPSPAAALDAAFARWSVDAVVNKGRGLLDEEAPVVSDATRAGGLNAFLDAWVAPGSEGVRCAGGIAGV